MKRTRREGTENVLSPRKERKSPGTSLEGCLEPQIVEIMSDPLTLTGVTIHGTEMGFTDVDNPHSEAGLGGCVLDNAQGLDVNSRDCVDLEEHPAKSARNRLKRTTPVQLTRSGTAVRKRYTPNKDQHLPTSKDKTPNKDAECYVASPQKKTPSKTPTTTPIKGHKRMKRSSGDTGTNSVSASVHPIRELSIFSGSKEGLDLVPEQTTPRKGAKRMHRPSGDCSITPNVENVSLSLNETTPGSATKGRKTPCSANKERRKSRRSVSEYKTKSPFKTNENKFVNRSRRATGDTSERRDTKFVPLENIALTAIPLTEPFCDSFYGEKSPIKMTTPVKKVRSRDAQKTETDESAKSPDRDDSKKSTDVKQKSGRKFSLYGLVAMEARKDIDRKKKKVPTATLR